MSPLSKEGGDIYRWNMKKNIIMLVTIILSALLLVGCKGSGSVEKTEGAEFVEGEWKLIRIESRDVVIEGDDLESLYTGGSFYRFNEDGGATITSHGYTTDGTWEERGDLGERFLMRFEHEEILFEKEYDYLVARPDGILMVFERME